MVLSSCRCSISGFFSGIFYALSEKYVSEDRKIGLGGTHFVMTDPKKGVDAYGG